jgi:hypothetical protein
MFHCSAAGPFAAVVENLNLSSPVPPGGAVFDDKDKVFDYANAVTAHAHANTAQTIDCFLSGHIVISTDNSMNYSLPSVNWRVLKSATART